MTNQDINREIAEAMTAQGFDEGLAWELQDKYIGTPDGHMILVPHNFTNSVGNPAASASRASRSDNSRFSWSVISSLLSH